MNRPLIWLMMILPAGPLPLVLADEGHHEGYAGHHSHAYYHYRDRPAYGFHVRTFYPDEYYPVMAGGRRYYYDDGIYYDYTGGEYVVASPPVGAVVNSIPGDFQQVIINGHTYYVNNGIYYMYTPDGYKVVSSPVQIQGRS